MDIEIAKEIIDCLPKDRTKFSYCKDQYAAFILSQAIGDECRVTDIKKTNYAGLLNKPLIKRFVSQLGDGVIRQTDFDYMWSEHAEDFLLSLDTWGRGKRRWDQVSRAGHNLVLQLNFSNQHDQLFQQLVKPEEDHHFSYHKHPVMKSGKRDFFRETLAWSRIDVDFETNEALIEELQTDWLRIARRIAKRLEKTRRIGYVYGVNTTAKNMQTYVETILCRYGKIWDEAMLTATLRFIRDELGIRHIYLHTPETGAALKKIQSRQPPRSLYTALPRKFCFTQTSEAPQFLSKSRGFRKMEKQLGGTQWNFLDIPLL